MEKASLFEHNEIAYQKLIDALKYNKCATINHATGTGKSFIALKYLYNNRGKKYLYIAPTYHIIEQLKSDCRKIGITTDDINIDTMIYRNLLGLNMDELYKRYDGIIFDEYHRIGAKETYKKIKELKLMLQEDDGEKRFIGLTATPIRYLDRERNMTNEIFDGVVASRISLSEAMIDGLLPVPIYINSKIACQDEYARLWKRTEKMAPTNEKNEIQEELKKIAIQLSKEDKNINQLLKRYVIEKDGKYIVFCNTINELESFYKTCDAWFEGIGNVKKYKVHSRQQGVDNVNQKNLDAFNNEKDGISVLFCVDVLNEGIHVDNVDGVICLRRTTSPIIYFQQIGRALSFSGRDKQIKIFDLVNNFGRHRAIEQVYDEYKQEISKRIKQEPQKKEYYEELLSRFKIMDETKETLGELGKIEKKLTREKIIQSKIDYSVKLLSERPELCSMRQIFEDEELKKAYDTISKYAKHVTNEQFEQLEKLYIILPSELATTKEERKRILKGHQSIYEKEKADFSNLTSQYIDYLKINRRRPDANSNNPEECRLANGYTMLISMLNVEEREQIKKAFDEAGLKLEPWEKVFLDERLDNDDFNALIKEALDCIEKNMVLPEHLYNALSEVTILYNIKQTIMIFKILEKLDEISKAEKEKQEQKRMMMISSIVEYMEQNINEPNSSTLNHDLEEKIKGMRVSDRNYISRVYLSLKRKKYHELLTLDNDSDLKQFCKGTREFKQEDIKKERKIINNNKEQYYTLSAIIDYIVENNGRIPNKDSEDEEERKLAVQMDLFDFDFSYIVGDSDTKIFSVRELTKPIINRNLHINEQKKVILDCLSFFYEYGRRPLSNSKDEDERKLAEDYSNKCISNMNPAEVQTLNRLFNSRRGIDITCDAFIENMMDKDKEERG